VTSGNTTVFGRGSIIDDSLLATDDVSIDLGGSLSGNGIVTGDVTNTGTVQPGDSVGLLALQGNLTQSSTGTLKIEISGSGPNDHDSLSITADATIDGTLDCSRELELVEAPTCIEARAIPRIRHAPLFASRSTAYCFHLRCERRNLLLLASECSPEVANGRVLLFQPLVCFEKLI